MLAYGMESAALTTADLHRLEAFQKDNPNAQTIRNEGVRALADQCPLTHYIHRVQLNEQLGKELCFYESLCLQGW